MLTPEYWAKICPRLSVSGGEGGLNPVAQVSAHRWQQEKNRLDYDGHVIFEEVFNDSGIECLKNAILDLDRAGLPAIFVSLFDEFWSLVRALQPIGKELLGEDYMIFPDYWVWHIDHRKDQAGWKPHRETTVTTADPNYGTDSISLWVALSDATTENGCVYVLPKSKDKGYPHTLKFNIETLQHVKALPVKAGSVIGWNQSVFHWGSSNSREATHPRISFAMELSRLSQPRDIPLMMSSDFKPSFEERLRLVATQFVNYKHLHGLSGNTEINAFVNSILGSSDASR